MDLSIACDPADELAPSHGLYDTLSSMRTPKEQTGGLVFLSDDLGGTALSNRARDSRWLPENRIEDFILSGYLIC